MLISLWTVGARFVGPTAAALASSRVTSADACHTDLDGDCDSPETDDTGGEADSDPENEEIPTVHNGRLWLVRDVSSELYLHYSGKARPGFSSPEPRPAEQV